jgi:DNA anti-recombination protein RmuC
VIGTAPASFGALFVIWQIDRFQDQLNQRIEDIRDSVARRVYDMRDTLGHRIDDSRDTLRAEFRTAISEVRFK